ncbi:translocation protein TolB [Carbonactinospora thermoautotrophica]|uniref:alkaline phosphatase PhoX n=1 Tax=Carbonactinospora thermoautotrophica TaxID=1469144 RepID=UPI00226F1E53|nr:alkaline phosphatase PhoX [Carbonactinospora thermoautotrophica]MCX9192652.1 translocation protein TolB [Carbonactinospora thermoautotrophica]
MERRTFLRTAVVGAGAAVAFGGSLWREAFAYPALPGPSPYGPLQPADANGIMLPQGFTSRVIARSGQQVSGTNHTWHNAPDGGACFADGTGWIYVSNAEVGGGGGGVSAVKFSSTGAIVGAYSILSGTNSNCSGGATPWNTWLSCEEVSLGYVYETDPWGVNAAVRRPAMGRFKHEAAAADPDRKVIYMTEDEPDGCFYRFVPTTWGDLSSGTLQVLTESGGVLSWVNVPDPDGSPTATRKQVSTAKKFNGGEGCYYTAGKCYFTTKGDNRVWAYDAVNNTLAIVYDDNVSGAPLTGVDNITSARSGDLFVAEDGGNMEICVITPDDIVAPFLRVTGQSSSELCGVAFNPAGDRLYFSSQRGTTGTSSGGITYEVTGPFRTTA